MLSSRNEDDKCVKFLKEIKFHLLLPETIYDEKLHSLGTPRKVELSLNFNLVVPSLIVFFPSYIHSNHS